MTANIKARRKLAALYERGVTVRFGPNGPKIGPFDDKCPPDCIELYVAVPSPLQREQAIRDARAQSINVKTRAKKDEENSVEGAITRDLVDQLNMDSLVEYLVMLDSSDRKGEAQRDVLSRDEWEDMPALQDQMRRYDDGEMEASGPEYEALMARDAEFGEEVRKREHELTDASREALAMLPREELERRVMDQQLDLIASEAFVTEYARQMMYYAARDPEDRQVLFFDSVQELASQDEEVQSTLEEALGRFIGDEAEAKNAPGAEDGSQSSTPPSSPETSEASTPEE